MVGTCWPMLLAAEDEDDREDEESPKHLVLGSAAGM